MAVEDWGLIDYNEAFVKQKLYVDEILKEQRQETLVFCSHSPVVTLGRGTQEGDVFAWKGKTIEVNRGGRATFHGPNQVVFYPIIKIQSKDLHGYMRVLEDAVVDVLSKYEVQAQGKAIGDATGVWVGERKVASIGIAVKKWVSSHGLALNLHQDDQAFTGIHPCGFKTQTMVSLEEVLGKPLSRESFQQDLLHSFCKRMYT